MNPQDYNKDYLRVVIEALDALHKPVIVRAEYQPKPHGRHFYTFRNVRAYAPGISGDTQLICDHISILQSDMQQVFGSDIEEPPIQGEVFLVTLPYSYFTDHVLRYGLRLTDVLGFPPIQQTSEKLDGLPRDAYVNFRKFAKGKYLKPPAVKKPVLTNPQKQPHLSKRNQGKLRCKARKRVRKQKIRHVMNLLHDMIEKETNAT